MHLKLNALLDSQGSLFIFLGFGTWERVLGELWSIQNVFFS